MEEINLPFMEILKALFQHRVRIQYSKDSDDLSVYPISGPFEGKCLIRLGMAQVMNAKVFMQNGKWTIEGELRSFAQKYAEDLKSFNPENKYQKINDYEQELTNLERRDEMLVMKENLYLLRSS